MEEWQDADEHVVVQCREGLCQRVDVGEHVGVREHHALGHAGAAAREDDGRQIAFRIAPRPVAMGQDRHRREARGDEGEELVFARDLLAEIFEEDHPRHLRQAGLLEKLPGREDRRDAGLLNGQVERFTADREVEVDRQLAGDAEPDVGQHGADRRRQQRADHRLARPCVARARVRTRTRR